MAESGTMQVAMRYDPNGRPAKYQGNGLARLLAVRLCIALMGCSALGFELPQPTQSSNPVIGAYKPPPFGIVRLLEHV